MNVQQHIFTQLKYFLFSLVLKSREVLMTLHSMLRSLHPFLVAFQGYFELHLNKNCQLGYLRAPLQHLFIGSKMKHLFAWINVINILINVYCSDVLSPVLIAVSFSIIQSP